MTVEDCKDETRKKSRGKTRSSHVTGTINPHRGTVSGPDTPVVEEATLPKAESFNSKSTVATFHDG